jgi:hypothetical protein
MGGPPELASWAHRMQRGPAIVQCEGCEIRIANGGLAEFPEGIALGTSGFEGWLAAVCGRYTGASLARLSRLQYPTP